MKKHTVTIGAFGIVTDNKDAVLLAHRTDRDVWNLPGGALEQGESPWESVIREVKEETGLTVVVKKLQGVYSKPHADDIVFNFVCDVVGGELTLNEEARDLRYFTLSEIPENIIPKHLERILDYYKDKDTVILKTQTGEPHPATSLSH